MADIRQSRPDHGVGFQVEVIETFQVVLLRSETDKCRAVGGGAGSGSEGCDRASRLDGWEGDCCL